MSVKQRPYIDFKLYLTRPADGTEGCQVALLPTPEVGETIHPVVVSAEKGPSKDLLPYLASKSITLRRLVQLGKGLANWLLPEETIRPLFVEALNQAGNTGGVRLRLIIADHDLKQWPWEYVYFDPLGGPDSTRGFLALEPRISIIRHEPLPFPHPKPTLEATAPTNLRLLVAAASPKGQEKLQLDQEITAIKEGLKDINIEGISLTAEPILMDATAPEVAQALMKGSTFIFQFVGHGTTKTVDDPFTLGGTKEEGILLFIDNKKTLSEAQVKADDLAKRLQQADVKLAVMGACYSGARNDRYPWDSVAGALAARGIPAIVAMQYSVVDTVAIKFSQAFYSALVSGLSLDEAMSFGRLAMYEVTGGDLDSTIKTEWGVPVLYNRLPHGIIMPVLAERETKTAEQIRTLVQQNVDTVGKDGKVTGISIYEITQNIGSISANVSQKAGTVNGEMTGIKIDSIKN